MKLPGEDVIWHLRRLQELLDPAIIPHLRRVAHLSALLAERADFPRDAVRRIELAAPLHDLGKLNLPGGLLQKAGKLTDDEFLQIQQHTTDGASILEGSPHELLQVAAHIARSHHERWDGKGYPEKLVGAEIPREARLVAIVDVYDALTSERVYKRAWSQAETLAFMANERAAAFDPQLLDLFLKLISEDQPADPVRKNPSRS